MIRNISTSIATVYAKRAVRRQDAAYLGADASWRPTFEEYFDVGVEAMYLALPSFRATRSSLKSGGTNHHSYGSRGEVIW